MSITGYIRGYLGMQWKQDSRFGLAEKFANLRMMEQRVNCEGLFRIFQS